MSCLVGEFNFQHCSMQLVLPLTSRYDKKRNKGTTRRDSYNNNQFKIALTVSSESDNTFGPSQKAKWPLKKQDRDGWRRRRNV